MTRSMLQTASIFAAAAGSILSASAAADISDTLRFSVDLDPALFDTFDMDNSLRRALMGGDESLDMTVDLSPEEWFGQARPGADGVCYDLSTVVGESSVRGGGGGATIYLFGGMLDSSATYCDDGTFQTFGLRLASVQGLAGDTSYDMRLTVRDAQGNMSLESLRPSSLVGATRVYAFELTVTDAISGSTVVVNGPPSSVTVTPTPGVLAAFGLTGLMARRKRTA